MSQQYLLSMYDVYQSHFRCISGRNKEPPRPYGALYSNDKRQITKA